ncbi:MAG: WD40 repeat domain-containing protein [Reyranella sp.]|uniref:WD40 repeat domain-containing protein n=1 Tax=Reyranella sp. TaxID=1929291 RepID=UPI003D0A3319
MKPDLSRPSMAGRLPPARSLAGDAPVAACAFNRDGTVVAFAMGDGRVRLLPADLGADLPEAAAPVHGGVVLSLIADPSGDGFVSGGDDGRLLRHGRDGSTSEIGSYKGKWIEHLAGHRSGLVAAAVGRNAIVVKDGDVRELGPHQSTVAGIDFSKDGSRIACAHYGGVTVWSIGQATQPPRLFAWRGSHVALKWSSDGRFIATGTQENDIHVWRIAQATDMRMQGYPAKVKSLAWASDSRFLCTSAQPVFTAWPFAGKGPEGKPPVQFGSEGAGLMTVVAALDTSHLVAGGYDSGEIQIGDVKNRQSMVVKLADGSPVTCLAWSPKASKLAVGNERGDLVVIDL